MLSRRPSICSCTVTGKNRRFTELVGRPTTYISRDSRRGTCGYPTQEIEKNGGRGPLLLRYGGQGPQKAIFGSRPRCLMLTVTRSGIRRCSREMGFWKSILGTPREGTPPGFRFGRAFEDGEADATLREQMRCPPDPVRVVSPGADRSVSGLEDYDHFRSLATPEDPAPRRLRTGELPGGSPNEGHNLAVLVAQKPSPRLPKPPVRFRMWTVRDRSRLRPVTRCFVESILRTKTENNRFRVRDLALDKFIFRVPPFLNPAELLLNKPLSTFLQPRRRPLSRSGRGAETSPAFEIPLFYPRPTMMSKNSFSACPSARERQFATTNVCVRGHVR